MSSKTARFKPAGQVETDRLDREAYASVLRRLPRLRSVVEKGETLLPRFGGLAQDIFAVYYKYNVVRVGASAPPAPAPAPRASSSARPSPSSHIEERVLSWVLAAPGLDKAKEQTRLRPLEAGLAAAGTLERVVELVSTRAWIDTDDLRQQWKSALLEEERSELNERIDVLEELEERGDLSEDAAEALERMRETMEGERDELDAELSRLARAQARELDRIPLSAENALKRQVGESGERLAEARQSGEQLGAELGGLDSQSVGRALALGDALVNNEKLKRLAALVGLFKQVARSSRRKTVTQRPQTVHSVRRGDDLGRVLSSDLVLLRHPTLRKEFRRRYLEASLNEYDVTAPDRSGKGPVVVCIDASGSMAGPREVWAKAIALTFLELARQERRAFRAIVFSSEARDTRRFDLLEDASSRRRLRQPRVELGALVDFTEYFPSGGTSFEGPLRLAIEALGESRFEGGDIVFITDGNAPISPVFRAWLAAERDRLGFRVFGVLVDVAKGQTQPLDAFADETLRVSELSAEALRPVFAKI